MTRRSVSILGSLLVCLWALPALAQEQSASTDPPAHVSVVDGSAVLERDGRSDSDLLSMPLLAGDRIRTQAGRVEILFADNSTLHLDDNTVVDFQSDEVVRLLGGRVRLSVSGPARSIAYRIDAPSAWVEITSPGEYRVALLRGEEVELAVLRGAAELVNEQGRSYVNAGERTYARARTAPSPAYVFNSAAWDSFDRWSESRRDQRLGVSAQYLPEDVRRYAPAFDNYGSWRHEQVYGYVWYPRVQVGWRPYHRGRWVSLRPYGWTWIAGDPWGWPTHHYGRWGISAGSWFWIPGRSWAPAWVSWAHAPGYVSWCPLGWNDRPVLQFAMNVYGGRRYDPWDAWSVLPRQHFGGGYVNVSRYRQVRIDPRLHRSFVVNGRGPDVNFAVNRSAVPIRTPGRSMAWRDDDRGGRRDLNGSRVPPDSNGRDVDRGFPSAARAPGSPITNRASDRGMRARDDARASVNEGAGQPRFGDAPAAVSEPHATSRTEAVPDYRVGAPRGGRRSDSPASPAVTAAPNGAVRAMPRMRSSDAAPRSSSETRQVRPFGASPRTGLPAEVAPPSPERRYGAPEPQYRAPQNRAITRGSEERSAPREPVNRGVQRHSDRYAPRSYGGGAERQAPAAAPRTDAPAPRSASPGPRGAGEPRPGGGSARDRGGEPRGTGQATGRRR